ncbi:hypothetical protein [Streptomyces sp. B29(2018)]|uniref:hypothetical protein n=1 Tax=Streptomyces sp. B29(2018) TaxID=2485016 RepID=UPI001F0C02C3|nr:hypothetical protein [Streptomyces sp. B29(2018)]
MNRNRLVSLTGGIAVIAGLLSAPAAIAAEPAPVALAGQVDQSTDLDNALFRAWVTPPAETLDDGEEIKSLSLDTGKPLKTHGSAFTLSVDPAAVPEAYIGPNGLVSLELEIYDPASQQYSWTTQSVRLVDTTTGSAAWAEPQNGQQPARGGTVEAAAVQPPTTTLKLRKASEGVAASFKTRAPVCTTTKTGQSDVWATIGSGYPAAPGYGTTRGKAWMTHSNGAEITYGAGLSTNGTNWEASGSVDVSNTKGFSFEWAASDWMTQVYRTQIRYYKYKYACDGLLRYYTMKAAAETGVVKTVKSKDLPPTWLSSSKCGFNYPAGTWTKTTGSAYSLASGVKISDIIGIDLRTSRKYTSGSTLSYKMSASHDSLCGNTDKPALAGKVQQFYNRIEEEL